MSAVRPLLFTTLLLILSVPRLARGAPSLDDEVAPLLESGDVDREDGLACPRCASRRARGDPARWPTWVALAVEVGAMDRGITDVGGTLVVGLPLERLVTRAPSGPGRLRSRRATAAATEGALTAAAVLAERPAEDGAPAESRAPPVLTGPVAREAVRAAWRAAGLEEGDRALSSAEERARTATVLPEARLRVMRMLDDRMRIDGATEARAYDLLGSRWMFEGRLTWRLDHLLYADDEPQLERLRLDRQEARARMASRVVEALLQWVRHTLDGGQASPGSLEARDASQRVIEAELTLDVLTAGWFTAWRWRSTAPAAAPAPPAEGPPPALRGTSP